MPDFIQPSFASGVLDPELHGRVDIAEYHAGLAEGRNMFVHPYGGVSNRAGSAASAAGARYTTHALHPPDTGIGNTTHPADRRHAFQAQCACERTASCPLQARPYAHVRTTDCTA